MRKVIELQMKLGERYIFNIQFDPRSRDEIPKLLRGLKAIHCDYCGRQLREQIFEVLVELVPPHVGPNNGRRGMDLWKIFVLGTLRLNCNWDLTNCLKLQTIISGSGKCSVME